MYDAIIIGARCAGSPTAMLLARKGYRVLLLDRAAFPSDITSTHYIHTPGIALLKRWGLLERLKATNCPPIRRIIFDVGPFALQGFAPDPDGITEAYCPRRTVLDKLLLDAAAEAGAEVRERFSVERVTRESDRVSGIQGRSSNGTTVMETAREVIGADGMHSLVARQAQAPEYNVIPPQACFYLSYWSGVPAQDVEWYPREHAGHLMALFPTNDGMVCLGVVRRNDAFAEYRSNIEGCYLKGLELVPQLAERVRQGKREESYRGMGDLRNFFRKPFGPGWALVGDAGYHKDPITGQGITDAFHDADLLTSALDDGFSGRRELSDAMAEYEQRRNQRVMAMYAFTCQMAALQPPTPDMQQLFSAMRGNQAEIENFFGTFAGTISIPEFFAPQNMARIIAAAGAQAASAQ